MKQFGTGVSPTEGPVGVGIDQSYTGFALAIVNPSGYAINVYTGKGKGVDRLLDIQHFLKASLFGLNSTLGIHDVAMEGYAPGSKFGREMAGELGGMVKMTLHGQNVYPLIVAPSSLKKYATGSGKTSKDQIMMHVLKKWGAEISDNNAADAYVLARIAAGYADHKYEQEVLDTVHREVA